ncbi:hypothetical protein K461DRAFT_283432 [Myriangium duriaei CBS 260.36]|uniref:Mediator of RNA polymerase II transcription subunit 17 n=1 Tax=Myriangium duriaei CBS 260.36 TaxID=1168546 RepID=A0A9P4IQI4_9PEZI|nr:hypothetical protein K461DRAFT_283432 [Myriangium duriaei CBS 260.36]
MADYDGVLPSSLQPWDHISNEPKSFGTVLGRIYAERGHFRHITEAQLRDEITTKAISGASSPSDSDSDEEDAKDSAASKAPRAEQLATARREVIEHVASAQNETLLALDFVSLLLSKDVKAAESTISPILKQSVPPGTLGLDMWAGMTPDAKQEETDRLLARGKRFQSLTQSADALMAAGDRLKTTVDRERRYWNEVLRVRQSGWNVCRMPRDKGVMGVRYGFSEARGEFARRGLAALKMGSEGNVVLDRGLGTEGKALRVRLVEDGVVKGESSIKGARDDDEELDVEARIRTARDSLFEEELWHEAMREARTLGSYGVGMKGNTITMPLSYVDTQNGNGPASQQLIEVDLVPLDTDVSHHPDPLANGIATALRLLLSHTHRQRLDQRSTIPPPLSSAKVEKPLASILRPLLSTLHHHAATTQLNAHLTSLTTTLNSASIPATITSTSPLVSALRNTTSASFLLSLLCAPRSSTTRLSLSLPSKTAPSALEIEVTTTTALSPPDTHGSRFTLSCSDVRFKRETASLAAVEEYVVAVVTFALAEAAKGWLEGWEADGWRGRVVRPAGRGGEGVVRVWVSKAGVGAEAGGRKWGWGSEGQEGRGFGDVMVDIVREVG